MAREDYFNEDLVVSNHQSLTSNLWETARQLANGHCFLVTEATTADFKKEQGRGYPDGDLPDHLRKRHEMVLRMNDFCYSMESSGLAQKVNNEYPDVQFAVVNAAYAERWRGSDEVKPTGDDLVIKIILTTIHGLAKL